MRLTEIHKRAQSLVLQRRIRITEVAERIVANREVVETVEREPTVINLPEFSPINEVTLPPTNVQVAAPVVNQYNQIAIPPSEVNVLPAESHHTHNVQVEAPKIETVNNIPPPNIVFQPQVIVDQIQLPPLTVPPDAINVVAEVKIEEKPEPKASRKEITVHRNPEDGVIERLTVEDK